MIRKNPQLYSSAVVAGLLFLVLLALAQANTTWAAHGEQGTIGKPTVTPTATTFHTPKPPCDKPCPETPTGVAGAATPTALPKLPVTGGDSGNGTWLIAFPLLLLLGAGLAWQGLRLARR